MVLDGLESGASLPAIVLSVGDSSIDLFLLHKGGSSICYCQVSSAGLYSLMDGLCPLARVWYRDTSHHFHPPFPFSLF